MINAKSARYLIAHSQYSKLKVKVFSLHWYILYLFPKKQLIIVDIENYLGSMSLMLSDINI